jgi:hypothetical protein|tara:strand:+ start:1865 stop:2089 length:225 start_codon:yes stop_codon:yes gene_type:complete
MAISDGMLLLNEVTTLLVVIDNMFGKLNLSLFTKSTIIILIVWRTPNMSDQHYMEMERYNDSNVVKLRSKIWND